MQILSVWILGFLLIGPTGAHGPHNFPETFVVVKKNTETVTLTCDANVDVTWKLEGDVIEEDDDDYKQDGTNLNIFNIESPMLGKYSCMSGDKELSSTHLLREVAEEEEENLDSFLNCWANSYDCTFNCTFKDAYAAVRLGLGDDCREGRKSCQWVTSSAKLPDGKFQFVLSHSLSPYAEETTKLELTAEAIINNSILRRTKRFYLRDIIQPDTPQIVKCQEQGQELNVTIDPPSSWSNPQSFFKLEHEIEYRLRDDGREITVKQYSPAMIEKKISMLRVRSRDPLVLSNWSQWTPWKNVIKKKKCLCLNTTNHCCPELPSGYMDKCKNKKPKRRNKKARRTKKQ